jgi:hypothetical protein
LLAQSICAIALVITATVTTLNLPDGSPERHGRAGQAGTSRIVRHAV